MQILPLKTGQALWQLKYLFFRGNIRKETINLMVSLKTHYFIFANLAVTLTLVVVKKNGKPVFSVSN